VVLHHCVERHILPPFYADEPVGLQILRGENIVLLGGLRTRELKGLTQTSVQDIRQKREEQRKAGGGEDDMKLKEDDDFALY
jgi:hypothetical protein